jgi:segregation and condensation protein B
MAAPEKLKNIIEAALLAAGGPLSLDMMLTLFLDEEQPEKKPRHRPRPDTTSASSE